jgi:hypothetical protein
VKKTCQIVLLLHLTQANTAYNTWPTPALLPKEFNTHMDVSCSLNWNKSTSQNPSSQRGSNGNHLIIMDGGYFSLKSRNLLIHSFTTLFQNPQQYFILSLYWIANHKLGFGATYQECQGHSKSKKNGKCNHSLQPFALIETLIFILLECLILLIWKPCH